MSERKVGGRVVELSREDKVLFPDCGLTKGGLADYLEKVAPAMLPHLEGRPLALQRFPDGIEEEGFYQKQVPDWFPDWISRQRVRTSDGHQELVVADSAATLVYLADQAAITLHSWLSRRDELEKPDRLVLDLDPPGKDFEPVREAARAAKELLDELELPSFLKTTGSRGLHVMVPLRREQGFDEVRELGKRFAALLASRRPEELTTEQRKEKRQGRLYLDVGRNAWGQTAVAPYSVRALPGAPVSAPLDWEELGDSALDARSWRVGNVLRRLGQRDCPWAGCDRHAVSLEAAGRRLARLEED